MTIDNAGIRIHGDYMLCEATVLSNRWCRFNDVMYRCDSGEWLSNFAISDNVKKKCRREWYKVAKAAGIKRKELNIII